jgi:hypothetical protein
MDWAIWDSRHLPPKQLPSSVMHDENDVKDLFNP